MDSHCTFTLEVKADLVECAVDKVVSDTEIVLIQSATVGFLISLCILEVTTSDYLYSSKTEHKAVGVNCRYEFIVSIKQGLGFGG